MGTGLVGDGFARGRVDGHWSQVTVYLIPDYRTLLELSPSIGLTCLIMGRSRLMYAGVLISIRLYMAGASLLRMYAGSRERPIAQVKGREDFN